MNAQKEIQNPILTEIAGPILKALKSHSIKADLTEFGDIKFKYKDQIFLIILEEEEKNYYRFCYPGVCSTDDYESSVIFESMNHANSKMKLAKSFIIDDYVWTSIEILSPDIDYFKRMIPRYIGIIINTVSIIREQLNDRSK